MTKSNRHASFTADHRLPIDSRILPDIFSFSHVKGLPKLFLIIEMILSVGMVLATGGIVLLHVLYF